MKPPIEKGERVVIRGNLQPYARAIVVECIYVTDQLRWSIIIEWPDSPGEGSKLSKVWDTDEGKSWCRYAALN